MNKLPGTLRPDVAEYSSLVGGISELLEAAWHASARAVNALMTATYWEIGRRIVVFEQHGRQRAEYGERLLEKLSSDLTARFGRGFGLVQVRIMRWFFLAYSEIRQSPIDELGASPIALAIRQSAIEESLRATPGILQRLANRFPLAWTPCTRRLRVRNPPPRQFYEAEALRGGSSVPQFERQMGPQFYGRTPLSRNETAILSERCHRCCCRGGASSWS
jgi:hypothetical protein